MRIGIHTAQLGRLADPAAVRAAAAAAEQVGYSSLWVLDHLPSAPADDDLELPRAVLPGLDPIAVLAATAVVTHRVRIGASVLVAPWYHPGLLARALTSIDVLSEGRLTVGLGVGLSPGELAALRMPRPELGARLEQTLDVLDAHWAGEQGELHPVQRPRPPVLLAAYGPAGLDRIARRADGWNPAGLSLAQLGPTWAGIRDAAAGYGRDPDGLQLVVRADIALDDRARPSGRAPYTGSVDQVADDIDTTRQLGAHEVILAVGGDLGLDEALDAYARIAEAVDLRETAADRRAAPHTVGPEVAPRDASARDVTS